METRKGARKGGGGFTSATTIAKKLAPRYGPSPKFELPNIDPVASVMTSSNTGSSDDVVQIVDDVIDITLIDNVVRSVGSVVKTFSTYTQLNWTPECEELLRAYQDKHTSVCPPNTDDSACSDAPARSPVSRR